MNLHPVIAALESQPLLWFFFAVIFVIALGMQFRLSLGQRRTIAELQHQQLALKEKLLQLQDVEISLKNIQQEAEDVRSERDVLRVDIARLEERVRHEVKSGEDRLALVTAARKQLSDEFQSLAGKIFEEKRQHFKQDSNEVLTGALSPLREQLKDFKRKVEDVYDKESKERLSLLHEVGQLKSLNEQMSQDAINLTRALKGDKKTQGNWGEVVLERVLEESGLRKGHEYITQTSYKTEDGQRRVPDVVVRLPEEKDIVIDSKVSLVDYERYTSSDDETERSEALRAHILAIRTHIESLSFKDYEQLQGLRTLDFVLIFIPIESAFMTAFDADPEMFSKAYERHIIVVSPTTLLATLRTVTSIWRYEQQNRNAEKIAAQAGAIHDQFVLVVESFLNLGQQLERSREAYELSLRRLNTGKGNLARRVSQLEELGARTKRKIPRELLEEGNADEAVDNEPPEEAEPASDGHIKP